MEPSKRAGTTVVVLAMAGMMPLLWPLRGIQGEAVDPHPRRPFPVNELLEQLNAQSRNTSQPRYPREQGREKKRKAALVSQTKKIASPVKTFAGSGSKTTRPLSVKTPWRIAWTGQDVFFFLKRADGSLVHGNGGNRSGTTLVIEETGRFHLDVIARGQWTIRVVKG